MSIRHRPADGNTRASAGFTLIEVLVALVIAALALGVLFEASVGGLRSARIAAQYQEALSRARSHLAALVGQTGFRAGTQSGRDGGGFRWRTHVQPIGVAEVAGPASATRPELFALSVTISWHDGKRAVTLHSERLGASPVRPP